MADVGIALSLALCWHNTRTLCTCTKISQVLFCPNKMPLNTLNKHIFLDLLFPFPSHLLNGTVGQVLP